GRMRAGKGDLQRPVPEEGHPRVGAEGGPPPSRRFALDGLLQSRWIRPVGQPESSRTSDGRGHRGVEADRGLQGLQRLHADALPGMPGQGALPELQRERAYPQMVLGTKRDLISSAPSATIPPRRTWSDRVGNLENGSL